jgi:hypothetical protein
MALKYSTVEQFAKTLGLISKIPSWGVGETPVNEAIGTGDSTQLIFYLDHKNILSGSYTIYADGTAMDETDDYALDLSTGKITLTEAGKIKLAGTAVTGKYSYINNEMEESFLQTILERAETEVDNDCNTIFIDTSVNNPEYILETEIQSSEGIFEDRIIVNKKPLIDISSSLSGAHDLTQETIDLKAGDGVLFPTSGNLIIDSEVISYTGTETDQLTGVTRGAMGTTAAEHLDEATVHSTILFLSDTAEGSSVSWTVQPWDSSMFAKDTGLLYSFLGAQTPLARIGVANRIKILYYYGYNSLPSDITRLALIYAKRQLIQDNIGKAMIAGRNEFKPEMFNADRDEIERIISSYIVLPMGNT